MPTRSWVLYSFLGLSLLSCVGEDIINDFVSPELRIENQLQSLGLNKSHQFEAKYLNSIGIQEDASITWSSSDETIVSIDSQTGFSTALQIGEVTIMAVINGNAPLSASTRVMVTDETIGEVGFRNGAIVSTSSYKLVGDFNLGPGSTNALVLSLFQNYEASSSLPGLYVYLTNNPNSINGAYEIGRVTVFNGAHAYTLPEEIAITDYNYILYWCKPFSVKVGGASIN